MILRNLPRVPAPAHDIVPELVPKRQRREARTRKLCDGREVEAVHGAVNRIQECKGEGEGDDDGEGGGEEREGEWHCGMRLGFFYPFLAFVGLPSTNV